MKRITIVKVLPILMLVFGVSFLPERSLAQVGSVSAGGCVASDKSKPPLFIAFESLTDKAWAGDKYEKGVLLRLTNNSNCTIGILAPFGEATKDRATLILRNGKLVRLPDKELFSLVSGQQVSVAYLMKYPGKKRMVSGGYGGDVLDTVYLNSERHIFFSVPLKNLQTGAELRIAFNYAWDEGDASQLIKKEGEKITQRDETVEHYLLFSARQLPENVFR